MTFSAVNKTERAAIAFVMNQVGANSFLMRCVVMPEAKLLIKAL